jgi:hypothetical protein
MSDLMQKLAVSKALMDRHNGMPRGQQGAGNYNVNIPEVQTFESPNPTYNLPQEFIQESSQQTVNPTQPLSKDKILNSRLPDEIKRLMIENPITPTNPLMGGGPVLSDELIEKATKLMGNKNQPQQLKEEKSTVKNNPSELKQMMREVVEEVLKENGLILESTSKTNETVVIKVGQHIFEGKISKVKKVK